MMETLYMAMSKWRKFQEHVVSNEFFLKSALEREWGMKIHEEKIVVNCSSKKI